MASLLPAEHLQNHLSMHVHSDWTGDTLHAWTSCGLHAYQCISDATSCVQVHGSWTGNGFPPPGTSYGRSSQYMMGTSPYGKSVDMVDVCTKLMEGATPPLQPACCLCRALAYTR